MIERNNFKPTASLGRIADRLEELLLLCDFGRAADPAITRAIADLQARLPFPTTVVNLAEYKVNCPQARLNGCLNLERFAAIVVHETLSANVADLNTIDAVLDVKIRDYGGGKLILHEGRCGGLASVMDYAKRNGIDRVITDSREGGAGLFAGASGDLLIRRQSVDDLASLLDDEIRATLTTRSRANLPIAHYDDQRQHVLLLTGHDLGLDPRVDWIRERAPAGLCIHQLAICGEGAPERLATDPSGGGRLHALPRHPSSAGVLNALGRLCLDDTASAAAFQELALMERALTMSVLDFSTFFGLPPYNQRGKWHRWYLEHFLSNALTLVKGALGFRGLSAIIATDLDTLIPALLLKGLLKVPVVYDAHEYWAESDSEIYDGERVYWMGLEKRLVPHTDARFVVTPGLADILGRSTGCAFEVLPNCEPLAKGTGIEGRDPSDGERRFLFQGGFVPGRGLDLLIDVWATVDPRATLHLRGRQSPYWHEVHARAAATGLLGTRIFFPDAVTEAELIPAAAAYDVGLVPYEPHGTNYRNCCPNKLSQYMAAGIAILANRTIFVDEIVTRSGGGLVVDFSRRHRLREAVNHLTAQPAEIRRLSARGRAYFAEHFNWENVSSGFYAKLKDLALAPAVTGLRIYATSVDGFAPTNEPYFLDRDPDGLG